MTTTTAEKPTCKYTTIDVVTYVACAGTEWQEHTKKWTYCPHCGKRIERETNV